MKKYIRIDWDFVQECKLFYFWNSFRIRTWMFKRTCHSCFDKSREFFTFYKLISLYAIGDFYCSNSVKSNYCPHCFFSLTKDKWEEIKKIFTNSNKVIKNKCSFCKEKNKENIRFLKNSYSVKNICFNCWNRENYHETLPDDFINESKKFTKLLFGQDHEENEEYHEFNCECRKKCNHEECECYCHVHCSCEKLCKKACKCYCHTNRERNN